MTKPYVILDADERDRWCAFFELANFGGDGVVIPLVDLAELWGLGHQDTAELAVSFVGRGMFHPVAGPRGVIAGCLVVGETVH